MAENWVLNTISKRIAITYIYRILCFLFHPLLKHFRINLPEDEDLTQGSLNILVFTCYSFTDKLLFYYAVRKKYSNSIILPQKRFFWKNTHNPSAKYNENLFFYPYFCRIKRNFSKISFYNTDRKRILRDLVLPSFNYQASFYPCIICLSRNPEKKWLRFIEFLLNYKDSFIRHSKPFIIESKPADILKMLVRMRSYSIRENKKQNLATKGRKILKKREQVRSLLNDRAVLEVLRKGDFNKNIKEAKAIFSNMTTDYSIPFLQIFNKVLTPLYSYLYNDINVNQEVLEEIRDIIACYPVIFIPNHRSHMDYLMVSYCLFKNHISCPLIAAGDNLNYFPLGLFFRKGGAFFIKRDFKDNMLYPQLFRHYLNLLLKNRRSIEFYIEGTRTRTGKLLSPKSGLLRLLLQGIRELKLKDLYIIPVSIEYDRVIEDSVLVDEDRGIPKKKEDLEGLFDIHNFIKKHYNNVYIHFSSPLSINRFLSDNLKIKSSRYTKKSLSALSEHIMERILYGMDTSGSTLLATLLFFESRWVSRSLLRWRLKNIASLIQHYKDSSIFDKFGSEEEFLDKYLSFFISQEFIIKSEKQNKVLYKVRSKKNRQILKYYFNNLSDMLLPNSLICFILKKFQYSCSETSPIFSTFDQLNRIFRHEFQFSEKFSKKENLLYIIEYISSINDDMEIKRVINFWSALSYHLRTGYCYSISIILKLLTDNGRTVQKNLIVQTVQLMDLYHKAGIIKDYNTVSTALISNTVGLLIDEGIIGIAENFDNPGDRILELSSSDTSSAEDIRNLITLDYERDESVWINDDIF